MTARTDEQPSGARQRRNGTSRWWLRPAYALGRGVRRLRLAGLITVLAFFGLWHLGAASDLSGIGQIPTPAGVVAHFVQVFAADPSYWQSWLISAERVASGFLVAVVLAVPSGVAFGLSRPVYRLVFPVFELLRPIPPLAWVPLSILFWPTHHLAIAFITFVGAYFIITINVFDGIRELPRQYLWLARSLGAKRRHLLLRIVLPAVVPALATGMTLGIAVTWNVLIAAEMIAGNIGLGRLTWEGYVSSTPAMVIVGMISIGVAGYLSSLVIDLIERAMMPWAKEKTSHGR